MQLSSLYIENTSTMLGIIYGIATELSVFLSYGANLTNCLAYCSANCLVIDLPEDRMALRKEMFRDGLDIVSYGSCELFCE